MSMLRIREVRACLFSMVSCEKTGRINKNLGRREGGWDGELSKGVQELKKSAWGRIFR